MDHKPLLDGGSVWSVTFDDYPLVARAGGAPLLAVSRDATNRGAVSVERVADAASPAVHRVLVAALSTLDSAGMFELSLEGVTTRAISVDASVQDMQEVSLPAAIVGVEARCFGFRIWFVSETCARGA